MSDSGLVDSTALSRDLETLAQANYGSYGMYMKVLETGEEAGYQADRPFYAASCYKLFQVMYIYESAAAGNIDLERIITYQGCDYEDGSGVIQNMPIGTALTTREVCEKAIVFSDNIAANMLRRAYGYRPYRDYATSIGCPVTGRYGPNQTTAREMGIVLMRVMQFADTNPLGQEVVSFLKNSIFKNRIPAGLPDGVPVGNKTGNYDGYSNDAAIVFMDDLTYILCVLSSGAPGYRIHAEASRLVYESIFKCHCGGGHCTTGASGPSTQWYFAEGTTREGFETWLCLANTGSERAHADVRALTNDSGVLDVAIEVAARSRVSLNINAVLGPGLDVAFCVTSDQPLLAERPMYFRYRDCWAGGHCVCGMTHPARDWYFAEGTTREEFETWLCLANPGDTDVQAMVRILTDRGGSINHTVTVPAMSRRTLLANELVGPGLDIALCVMADAPILVERSVYFSYKGQWNGGHCTAGITQPSTQWYFAEGTTRKGFETWLCLANPGEEEAWVEIEYLLAGADAVHRSYRLPSHGRSTLLLNEVLGDGLDVSSHVSSDMPILAERPVYFKSAMGGSDGHCVTGIMETGKEWYFAEGNTREGFEQWVCIGNPNDSPTRVDVEFLNEKGETISLSLYLGSLSRFTLRVGDAVEGWHDISTLISSDLEVIAERPMYFLFSPMAI